MLLVLTKIIFVSWEWDVLLKTNFIFLLLEPKIESIIRFFSSVWWLSVLKTLMKKHREHLRIMNGIPVIIGKWKTRIIGKTVWVLRKAKDLWWPSCLLCLDTMDFNSLSFHKCSMTFDEKDPHLQPEDEAQLTWFSVGDGVIV